MRDVCEDRAVELAVNAAVQRWHRADEAWEAVVWALARDPHGAGPAVTSSGLSRMIVFDGARSIDMPSLRAVYVIHSDKVQIVEVEFYDSPHAFIGHA